MRTTNQVVKKTKNLKKQKKNVSYRLHNSPQKKAVLIKRTLEQSQFHKRAKSKPKTIESMIRVKPRKPNSGQRKVCWVKVQKIMLGVYMKKKNKLNTVTVNKKLNGKPLPRLRRERKQYLHKFFARIPGNSLFAFKKDPNKSYTDDWYQNLKTYNKVLLRGGRGKDTPGVRYRIIHKDNWRITRRRKANPYKLFALPWEVFKQRRSIYGIRRRKYLVIDDINIRNVTDYSDWKDRSRQEAGCLKKKTISKINTYDKVTIINMKYPTPTHERDYGHYRRQLKKTVRNKWKYKHNYF